MKICKQDFRGFWFVRIGHSFGLVARSSVPTEHLFQRVSLAPVRRRAQHVAPHKKAHFRLNNHNVHGGERGLQHRTQVQEPAGTKKILRGESPCQMRRVHLGPESFGANVGRMCELAVQTGCAKFGEHIVPILPAGQEFLVRKNSKLKVPAQRSRVRTPFNLKVSNAPPGLL